MAKARIQGRVDMDASSVGTALGKASSQASAFAAKMKGIGKGLAGAFTVGAIASIGKTMLKETDRIADLAANLQISSDALQAFEGVARTAGAGVDKLDSSLEKLQQVQGNIAAGTGETAKQSLIALGLSAEDALLPIEELFQKIAQGFSETGNIGALDELFGRGAVQLSNTLREIAKYGNVLDLVNEMGSRGLVMPAGEIQRSGGITDTAADLGARLLKFTTSALTPGAADTAAKQAQEENIRAGVEQRRKIAEAVSESERATKRAELEKIISGATSSQGIGSDLVRIGARGGIAGVEDKAVKLAREQLAALKQVASNTEDIDKIATGVFIPP